MGPVEISRVSAIRRNRGIVTPPYCHCRRPRLPLSEDFSYRRHSEDFVLSVDVRRFLKFSENFPCGIILACLKGREVVL